MTQDGVQTPPATGRTAQPVWPALLWLLGLWWLSAQFRGLELQDDSGPYTLEAMRLLMPGAYAGDTYFAGASQGNYSLFVPLYAQLIQWLGLKPAGWLLVMAGRVCWGVGAVWLARALWRRSPQPGFWLVGLALMLLLPAYYDSYGMFRYGSTEITPRLWAEASLLCALALHWEQRRWASWALGLVGLLMHPLMALPGVVLLLLLQPSRVRNAGLVLGGVAVLGAASLGLGPLGGLFQRFDSFWWESVVNFTGYVLAQTWSWAALSKAGLGLVLLGMAAHLHPEATLRHLARCLLVLSALLLALWVGASVGHNVLLVQMQLWRVLWLVQLLAPVLWLGCLPPWQRWGLWEFSLAVVVLVALAVPAPWWAGVAVLAVVGSHPQLAARWATPEAHKAAAVVAAGVAVMGVLSQVGAFSGLLRVNQAREVVFAPLVTWAAGALWTLPLTVLLGWLWMRTQALAHPGLWKVVGAVFLPWVVGLTVVQVQEMRQPLSYAPEQPRLSLPDGVPVYSDLHSHALWFGFQRAAYLTAPQGVSALFSRASAVEFRRRLAGLSESGLLGLVPPPEVYNRSLPWNPYRLLDTPESQAAMATLLAQNLQLAQHDLRALSPDVILAACQAPALRAVMLSLAIPDADQAIAYHDVPGKALSLLACPQGQQMPRWAQ